MSIVSTARSGRRLNLARLSGVAHSNSTPNRDVTPFRVLPYLGALYTTAAPAGRGQA